MYIELEKTDRVRIELKDHDKTIRKTTFSLGALDDDDLQTLNEKMKKMTAANSAESIVESTYEFNNIASKPFDSKISVELYVSDMRKSEPKIQKSIFKSDNAKQIEHAKNIMVYITTILAPKYKDAKPQIPETEHINRNTPITTGTINHWDNDPTPEQ